MKRFVVGNRFMAELKASVEVESIVATHLGMHEGFNAAALDVS